MKLRTFVAACCTVLVPGIASADAQAAAEQVTAHMGRMSMPIEMQQVGFERDEALQYEPYQMLNDFLSRDDLVFLMRHGPTDWSVRDRRGVAATDCENQRVMSQYGMRRMATLGAYLTFFNLRPGQIVVSEWCRNQQTLESMMLGMRAMDEEYAENLPVEVDPEVNLLLSLGGAENVTALRERVLAWDGEEAGGPLLIITHFTNIAELTQFNTYEGEILVLDPTLDGRVLGYIRLESAAPDVGHFASGSGGSPQ